MVYHLRGGWLDDSFRVFPVTHSGLARIQRRKKRKKKPTAVVNATNPLRMT